jgi:hypothetical protein
MGARGRKSKAQLMVVQSEPSPAPASKSSASVSPPGDLGPNGKKLWGDITRDYALETSAEMQMLFEICVMADRAANLRKRIDKEGEVLKLSEAGLPRDHPCLKHELAARAFIVRSLANLFAREPDEKPRYRSSRGYYG